MRTSVKFLSLFLLSVLVLPGCYTQLKVSESDDKYSEREYYSEYESDYRSYSADDSTYVSGYRDGVFDANRYFKNYDVYHRWNRYNNVSFNHYYPYSYYDYPRLRSYLSISFGHGWAGHGWSYYTGFGYGYGDPFFYDPFYAGFSPFYGHRGYYGSGYHNYGFPNYYAYYHNDFKRKRDDTKYQYGPRNSGSLSVEGRNSRISSNGPSVSSAYLKSLAPTSGSSGQNGNVRSEYLRPSRTRNSNNGALPSIGNFMRSIFESSNGYTRSRTLNVDSPRTRGSRTGNSGTTVRKSRSGSGSSSSAVRSSSSGSSKSSSSSSGKRPSRVDR